MERQAATSPALVPRGWLPQNPSQVLSLETLSHLRFMMQKYQLGQDTLLVGPPGPERFRLAMAFCELLGLEAEIVRLSRDTTESDLKQRRETLSRGHAAWVDQAPVRAALNGRVLIVDGLEKAERNVLPTLNNLLENREMSLEDGRMLLPSSRYDEITGGVTSDQGSQGTQSSGSRLARVSDRFRVIGLACPVPPYPGMPLDPPLRSRFQARYVDPLHVASSIGGLSIGGVGMRPGVNPSPSFLSDPRADAMPMPMRAGGDRGTGTGDTSKHSSSSGGLEFGSESDLHRAATEIAASLHVLEGASAVGEIGRASCRERVLYTV